MAKNQESINRSLFELLRSRGYAPTLLDTSGKEIPVPEEAEVFQFKFTKDGEEYGTVTASIDGLHKLIIYFGDDVANSEKEASASGDDSWYKLLNHLKRFSQQHQLSFEVKNRDHLKYDMAKREHMKKQERISEGYYPMGKSRSYNDNVPTVKIVIEHTRQIEEGEQRYRNVNRIFLENTHGERILAPTTKPGVAQIYARHLAEGGMPHDDRWNHIIGLCEEYNKMGAFVRAIRNNQFNESAQQLVNEGINHYQSLRESLSKMRGTRGYNAYFESYTPPLMEDETEENNLNELFVQETLDPRIESVMPILSKLHKKVAEMKEVNELSEWADNLIDEGVAVDAYMAGKSPALAHFADQLDKDVDEDDLDEGLMDKIKGVATKGMNWATNKAQPAAAPAAPAAVVPNAATQARIAAAPQGYDPNTGKPQVAARAVPGAVQKGGTMDMSKKVTPVARPAAAPAQSDYDYSPQEVQQMNQQIAAMDPSTLAQVAARTNLDPTVTAAVKAEVTRRKTPPAAQPNAGAPVEEGMVDTIKSGVKKGMDTVKKVGGEVLDKLGGGSEEQLIRDLQKAAGVKVTGKKPEPKDKDVEEGFMGALAGGGLGLLASGGNPLVGAAGAYAGHKIQQQGIKDPDAEYKKAQQLKQQQTKDVGEGLDDAQKADQKIKTPAVDRKEKGGDWKVTTQDLAKADENNMTSSAGMAALQKKLFNIEKS